MMIARKAYGSTTAFTIVEVLVALTLIGIALMPVFALMRDYLKAEAKNDFRKDALQTAVCALEQVLLSESARDSVAEFVLGGQPCVLEVKVLDGDRFDEPPNGTRPLEIHVRICDKKQRSIIELKALR